MNAIDVYRMAREGSALQGRIAIGEMPRLASSLARAEGALSYECEGRTDDRGRPALLLRIAADLPMVCDRCGGEMRLALRAEKMFFFVRTEQDLSAIPIDESVEEPLLGSSRFDLAGLIEDEAILHLPISPRHDACALPADSEAAFAVDAVRNPFAALGALREQPREAPPSRRAASSHSASGTKRAKGPRKVRRSMH